MQTILIAIIRCYQKSLSYIIGNQCRFHPSCSQYSIESIKQYGSIKGIWLTARRILRCNPMFEGGHDPIPETFYWFNKTKD